MERVMREMHGDMPPTKRILELNGEHPLVGLLERLHGEEESAFEDFTRLLHGQALIAEGSPVADPAAFAGLVTRLMVKASKA
jgi:molecular chaperone HtpG